MFDVSQLLIRLNGCTVRVRLRSTICFSHMETEQYQKHMSANIYDEGTDDERLRIEHVLY